MDVISKSHGNNRFIRKLESIHEMSYHFVCLFFFSLCWVVIKTIALCAHKSGV